MLLYLAPHSAARGSSLQRARSRIIYGACVWGVAVFWTRETSHGSWRRRDISATWACRVTSGCITCTASGKRWVPTVVCGPTAGLSATRKSPRLISMRCVVLCAARAGPSGLFSGRNPLQPGAFQTSARVPHAHLEQTLCGPGATFSPPLSSNAPCWAILVPHGGPSRALVAGKRRSQHTLFASWTILAPSPDMGPRPASP